MCVHNGARHLSEALQSMAGQTFTDYEFIIVDDCSTDGSTERLQAAAQGDKRIRIHQLGKNVGLTRALNYGLGMAKGRYIARIDDDDRCHADRLRRQFEYLEAHPDHMAIGCGYRVIDDQGRTVRVVKEPLDDWQIRWLGGFNPPAPHPTYFFRRLAPDGSALRYDESFRTAQDFDLWSRMTEMGKTAVLAEVLVDYRRHARAITVRNRAVQAKNCQITGRRNLARRFSKQEMDLLEPFLAMFAYERSADIVSTKAVVRSLDLMVRHDLPMAPSAAHKRWLRVKSSGLLADTLLSRGGALRNPSGLLAFIFFAWRYLPGLAVATAQSPALAAKSLSQVSRFNGPANPSH
jgi:glycosyltransferase involved in cell wall biosynthesis